MADKHLRVPPEMEDVASQIGEFIEYWGFKNVHGRIWTHLFLAETPLDASDIVERLCISKALVSMSISDLLEYEVIQFAGKSERSTVLYKANPNVTSVIVNVLRKRERRMLSRISSAVRLLKTLPQDQNHMKLSPGRVDSLNDLVQSAETSLDAILQMAGIDYSAWAKFNDIQSPTPAAHIKDATKD